MPFPAVVVSHNIQYDKSSTEPFTGSFRMFVPLPFDEPFIIKARVTESSRHSRESNECQLIITLDAYSNGVKF